MRSSYSYLVFNGLPVRQNRGVYHVDVSVGRSVHEMIDMTFPPPVDFITIEAIGTAQTLAQKFMRKMCQPHLSSLSPLSPSPSSSSPATIATATTGVTSPFSLPPNVSFFEDDPSVSLLHDVSLDPSILAIVYYLGLFEIRMMSPVTDSSVEMRLLKKRWLSIFPSNNTNLVGRGGHDAVGVGGTTNRNSASALGDGKDGERGRAKEMCDGRREESKRECDPDNNDDDDDDDYIVSKMHAFLCLLAAREFIASDALRAYPPPPYVHVCRDECGYGHADCASFGQYSRCMQDRVIRGEQFVCRAVRLERYTISNRKSKDWVPIHSIRMLGMYYAVVGGGDGDGGGGATVCEDADFDPMSRVRDIVLAARDRVEDWYDNGCHVPSSVFEPLFKESEAMWYQSQILAHPFFADLQVSIASLGDTITSTCVGLDHAMVDDNVTSPPRSSSSSSSHAKKKKKKKRSITREATTKSTTATTTTSKAKRRGRKSQGEGDRPTARLSRPRHSHSSTRIPYSARLVEDDDDEDN